MSAIQWIILLFIAQCCQAQQQCSGRKPFLMPDKSCADFSEVCLKKDFQPCATLLDACQQCPPSNFTTLMLLDVFNATKVQSNLTEGALKKIFDVLQGQLWMQHSNLSTKFDARCGGLSNPIIALLIIILVVLVALGICGLVVWFKFCRKKHVTRTRKEREENSTTDAERLLARNPNNGMELTTQVIVPILHTDSIDVGRSAPSQADSDSNKNSPVQIQKVMDIITGLWGHIDSRFEDLYAITKPSLNMDSSNSIISFEINGKSDIINLLVHESDNIVKIKRVICSKLLHLEPDDCKLMKLKYNGNILDDNEYLSKYVQFPSSNGIIHCEFDDYVVASNVVLLKLQGKDQVPYLIQMMKNQEIAQLKEIAANLKIGANLVIVKSLKALRSLDSSSTLSENGLEDGDWLIEKQVKRKFPINSIFGERNSISVEYCNLDLLSSVKGKVAQEIGCSPDTIFLILWNKYLSTEDEYLFKMGISPESVVKFFRMRNLENVEISETWLAKGDFSHIFEATETLTKKKIIMKKYDTDFTKNFKDNKIFITELITFQLMEPYKRILQLKDVFKDDSAVYVSLEKMTQSVEEFAKSKTTYHDKWLSQILEGLKYLHKNQIIHRNLKPSNILLDEHNDIKLSSFGLSKYIRSCDSNQVSEDVNLANIGTCRYIAPEILNNLPHGTAADVWSYGASLILIITGLRPYSHLNNYDEILNVAKQGWIDLETFQTLTPDEKDLIGMCLKKNPIERASIELLLETVNVGNNFNSL